MNPHLSSDVRGSWFVVDGGTANVERRTSNPERRTPNDERRTSR